MLDREQIRPLATETEQQIISDDEESNVASDKQLSMRKKRRQKWCFSIAALVLILAIVMITLVFTIFKVQAPIVRMNGVSVAQFDLNDPINISNMTIIGDVSVKNPNYASFKYTNTTTSIFYHGTLVGEARGPPGEAEARRTMRMNLTGDIMTDRVLSNSMFPIDFGDGSISMNSFTSVKGRVKMLKIIKRHVVVNMNCTIAVNVATQEIQKQECKQEVKL